MLDLYFVAFHWRYQEEAQPDVDVNDGGHQNKTKQNIKSK